MCFLDILEIIRIKLTQDLRRDCNKTKATSLCIHQIIIIKSFNYQHSFRDHILW